MRKNHFVKVLKKRGTPFKVVLLLGFLGLMFVNMGCRVDWGETPCEKLEKCLTKAKYNCPYTNISSSPSACKPFPSNRGGYRYECKGAFQTSPKRCYSWNSKNSHSNQTRKDACTNCSF